MSFQSDKYLLSEFLTAITGTFKKQNLYICLNVAIYISSISSSIPNRYKKQFGIHFNIKMYAKLF